MKKFLVLILIFCLSTIIFILIISSKNKAQIKPDSREIRALRSFFRDIEIKKDDDILRIQNFLVENIKSKYNGSDEIDIIKILKDKYGYCFDRSMILQKIMLYNKIEIRPVFLYVDINKSETNFWDIFSKNIKTHNIFEIYWKKKWVVINTNTVMKEFQTLESYLDSQTLFPKRPNFLRHLNNRNGRFIAPSYIPDIY